MSYLLETIYLLRMTNAFQVSQAIHVAATLGIADLLEDGPRSADELAEGTGTDAPTLYRLLRALASVGVFTEIDGRFGLTPLAEYLRTDAPGSLRAWAMQVGQRYFWTSWGHLLHSVRTGEPAFAELYGTTPWEYRAAHPEEDAVFNAAMTNLSAGVVEAVARRYDFSGYGVLVDVGGGQGALLAAILAANPNLRGILFDQPHIVAAAGALLEQAGVADRCEVVGGSFFDTVPAGLTLTCSRASSTTGMTRRRSRSCASAARRWPIPEDSSWSSSSSGRGTSRTRRSSLT